MKITKKSVNYCLAAAIPILWVLRIILLRIHFIYSQRVMPFLVQYVVFVGVVVLAMLYLNVGKDRKKMISSACLYSFVSLAVEKAIYMAANLLGSWISAAMPYLIIKNIIQICTSFFIMVFVLSFITGFSFKQNFSVKKLLRTIGSNGFILSLLLCIFVLCIWGDWMEIQRFQSMFYGNAYALFDAMTAPGALFSTVREWYIPYVIKACALLFYLALVDEKQSYK